MSAPASIGPRDVCIAGVSRTPMGGFSGSLSTVPATELGSIAIKSAIDRAGITCTDVQEVFFGNVISSNLGQAPARQAALKAGIPNTTPCTTVNKICSSGMKATMFGAQSIMLGLNDVVVVGGMENMSRAPHYIDGVRLGPRLGHGALTDSVLKDGLWDAHSDQHMGSCAELCASKHAFDKPAQDAHAVESYRRSKVAAESGKFEAEITPVEISSRRGVTKVSSDEEVAKHGDMGPEKMSGLRPAFIKDGSGTVSAGNASPLSDGAAALVLVSGACARERGLSVVAVIRGFGDAAHSPEEFTTAPALAVPRALQHAGLSLAQMDFIELNEAFSVVALANTKLLQLDPAKVNVYGGAVSMGHPLGCSGARILVTLCSILSQEGGRFGVAGICNGGGGASAMVLERVTAPASAL